MKSERNDFADLVRTIVSHNNLHNMDAIAAVTSAASMAYIILHPETEWSWRDVTDDVRAEVPHLKLPDDLQFYIREVRITEDPIRTIDQGMELLGLTNDPVHLQAAENMYAKMRESPDGRITINGMVSTPFGVHGLDPSMTGGWNPNKSELRVLHHALDTIASKYTTINGEYRVSGQGGQWSTRLAGTALESVMTEATGVLNDDEAIVSAIDAWASAYKDEGG